MSAPVPIDHHRLGVPQPSRSVKMVAAIVPLA